MSPLGSSIGVRTDKLASIHTNSVTLLTSDVIALATIESLKTEIKTQRKEIAVLREERRSLLDRDKVPEMGWKE